MVAGWSSRLLDVLYPPRCASCRAVGSWLCPACRATMQPVPRPYCARCGQTLWGVDCQHCAAAPLEIDGIRAATLFEGPVRQAIHRLKYGNLTAVAPALSTLLAGAYREAAWRAELVIPVPLHPSRERQRGYNQAAELAKPLARELGLSCLPSSLRRIRPTADQIGLGVQQRQANVLGAFAVRSPVTVAGRTVLLVDDVATTGYTLNACARVVRQAGALAAYGIVVARRSLDDDVPNSGKGAS